MRIVVQRVESAMVTVNDKIVASIGKGLLLFVGFQKNEDKSAIDYWVNKIINLRIFSDENNLMNKSVLNINGGIILVSKFTLYGNCAKGNRPSFSEAMPYNEAKLFYEDFVNKFKEVFPTLQTGLFGAHMKINLVNDGPVTFLLEGR